ncbi:hypothetical protein LY28_01175 [Ruminiclostridium sufflavum DSM 19573]|uniref:Uncharacterized protein n=1 Tax=Ruminiclostridium sufflavum DSM 19573 TaxID=1121337 RepID=A0A318XP46_9FIRM|nr:hypothetical protein [Ruminiclostridium sufflavum]PYG88815.1 hypothetical protein LY28_01175 [Ruminiclostridium sufflavum DSM 19573]
MNNSLFIITSRKKMLFCLMAILFIVLSAFFISNLNYSRYPQSVDVDNCKTQPALSPENENKQLKGILSSIIPSEDKVLYENGLREIADPDIQPVFSAATPKEILDKGKTLSYIFTYTNEEYLRPIYSDTWKQAYYQGWLYLPEKIITARHSIFVYTGNESTAFNLEGELGFYPSVSIDDQNYINIMIYNFDLQNVVQYENQIAISGMPAKKGVQIISVKIGDVSAQTNEEKQMSIHLCTPGGLEIDYQNINFPHVPNGENDFGTVEETFSNTSSVANNIPDNIAEENTLLKQELTHYISDSSNPIYFQYNGGYQASGILNTNLDLENAISSSSGINYSILYNNKNYVRPVYHPEWKKHSDRDWCYVPRKMYLNMKKLFALSSDKDIAFDLCAELGFFEEHPALNKDQIGLLIYNFSVTKASISEDNVLLTGIPSRTGVQLVSIPKADLGKKYIEYAVRLVTKDFCEIDADVVKNN